MKPCLLTRKLYFFPLIRQTRAHPKTWHQTPLSALGLLGVLGTTSREEKGALCAQTLRLHAAHHATALPARIYASRRGLKSASPPPFHLLVVPLKLLPRYPGSRSPSRTFSERTGIQTPHQSCFTPGLRGAAWELGAAAADMGRCRSQQCGEVTSSVPSCLLPSPRAGSCMLSSGLNINRLGTVQGQMGLRSDLGKDVTSGESNAKEVPARCFLTPASGIPDPGAITTSLQPSLSPARVLWSPQYSCCSHCCCRPRDSPPPELLEESPAHQHLTFVVQFLLEGGVCVAGEMSFLEGTLCCCRPGGDKVLGKGTVLLGDTLLSSSRKAFLHHPPRLLSCFLHPLGWSSSAACSMGRVYVSRAA